MNKKSILRRKFIVEGIIAIIIVLSPIIHYSWKYIPKGNQELPFLWFTFSSNGFEDVGYAFYYYLVKAVPLMLMFIWFITSKEWWYHAILIAMTMYAFQLFSAITFKSNIIDENEILYIVGIAMVITPIVYFVRLKLVDKYVHGIDLKAMDDELKLLKEKERLEKDLEKLRRKKETLSKKM